MNEVRDAVLFPEHAVITWHWIDTDGQPPKPGYYLAAWDDNIGELYWSPRGNWIDDTDDSPSYTGVVAWAELPAFPTRPT